MTVTTFLFIGRAGPSQLAQWVLGARLAAAQDTLRQLARLPEVARIVVATNMPELADRYPGWPVTWDIDPPDRPFHFGARLRDLLAAYQAPVYAYFGAGCAPLLTDDLLAEAIAEVARAAAPRAVTNNALSSDWIVFNCPAEVQARPDRLARDNMLGPVLKYEVGIDVGSLPASAATRADIDTPADALALSLHPRLQPALARYLSQLPLSPDRWQQALQALARPNSRLALIGRVSSAAWNYLESRTRCWTRVFSEERGMTASGRQAAGEVRSLIAAHIARVGVKVFFGELADMADAVFFDTRVLLTITGWPPAADRYASDAGRPELIQDPFLRELTEAALKAPMPVLIGGHGVVAGDLYALVEALELGAGK
jgi:hypothetical protein